MSSDIPSKLKQYEWAIHRIIIIIIIRNLYSAIMPLGGYRGAGSYRGINI